MIIFFLSAKLGLLNTIFVKQKTELMKKYTLFLIGALAIILGCKREKSETVDPDNVQQEIWHIYDSDNNDTYFGIRFYDYTWYRRVILNPPSSITLNGNKMIFNEGIAYYEANYDNEQVTSGQFIYTDAWNRVYKNTTEIENSIQLPAIDTIYRSKDNVITWIGDPCAGSKEKITLHVGIILPLYSVSTNVAGATSITLKQGDLGADLGSGLTRIRIDRETSGGLQEATKSGGVMTRKYKSKVKWVYVK